MPTRRALPISCIAGRAVMFAALLWPVALASPSRAQDDEDEPVRIPGLIASYFVQGDDGQDQTAPLFARLEASPALLLKTGEAPDSRLPAEGWRGQWRGVLEILQPGRYRFFAHRTG